MPYLIVDCAVRIHVPILKLYFAAPSRTREKSALSARSEIHSSARTAESIRTWFTDNRAHYTNDLSHLNPRLESILSPSLKLGRSWSQLKPQICPALLSCHLWIKCIIRSLNRKSYGQLTPDINMTVSFFAGEFLPHRTWHFGGHAKLHTGSSVALCTSSVHLRASAKSPLVQNRLTAVRRVLSGRV
jgi:hypothetical protein